MKFSICQFLLFAALSETSANRNLRTRSRKTLEASAAIEILQTSNLITADLNADGQLSMHEFTVLLIQNGVTNLTVQGVQDLYNSIVADGQTSIVVADFDSSNSLISNVDATVEELVNDVETIVDETVTDIDATLENVEVVVDNLIDNIDISFKNFLANLDVSLFDSDGDGTVNLLESTVGLDGNGVTAVVAADSQITALEDLINISTDGTVSVADLGASLNIEGASAEAEFNAETGGAINVQEFVYALNDAEIVSLTVEEANGLLGQLQGSVDNSVQLTDLATVLTDLVEVINRISESFQTFLNNLDLTTVLDVDGDGSTNLLESTIGLDSAGISAFVATDAQISALQNILATASVDGTVSLEDVQAAVNIDGEVYADVTFDTETGGSINIEEFLFGLSSGGIVDVSVAELNTLVADLDATVDNVLNLQDLESTLTALLDNISNAFQSFLDNLDVSATNLLDSTVALDAAGVSAFVATDAQVTALKDILNTNVDVDISIADLQAAIAVDGATYADVTFDAETGGSINLEELLFGVEASGIASLSSDELNSLVADLDASVDNVLNLQDLENTLTALLDNISDVFQSFLDNLDVSATNLLESTVALDAAGISAFVSTDAQVTALRDILNTNVDADISIADLQAAVAVDGATYADVTFDAETGGSINLEELLLGLEASGIASFSSDELNSFVVDLEASVDNVLTLEGLRATLTAMLDNISDAFQTFLSNFDVGAVLDGDGDGTLTLMDSTVALDAAGISAFVATDAQISALQDLALSVDGTVSLADVAAAISIDGEIYTDVTFDAEAGGSVNIEELLIGLETSGIVDITIDELNAVIAGLEGGSLSLAELNSFLADLVDNVVKYVGTTLGDIRAALDNVDANLIVDIGDLDLALFDSNGDGFLGKVELETGLTNAGITGYTTAQIGGLYVSLDVDGDGKVAFAEIELPRIFEALGSVDVADFDVDLDGNLNIFEFFNAIATAGVTDLTVDEISLMFDYLDADGDLVVAINDLSVAVEIPELVNFEHCGTINLYELGRRIAALDVDVDLTTTAGVDALLSIVNDVSVDINGIIENVEATIDEVVDEVEETIENLVENVVEPTVDEVVDIVDEVVDVVDEVIDTPAVDVNVDTSVDISLGNGGKIDLSSPLLNQELVASLNGLDVTIFDTNGSGAIDLLEFTVGLIQSGIRATSADIKALAQALDLDGDLQILNADFTATFGASN